jgi:phosphate transport system protein
LSVERLMDRLHQELAALSEMAERNVNTAIMSLIERSEEMAREVVGYDAQVDEMELDVDRRCIEILRLEHPKSDNFRFVIAAMKINTELERISDLASDIAGQVVALVRKRSLQADLGHFAEMLEFSSMMVRDSVKSLLERNGELAWRVCAHDDLVDEACRSIEEQLYRIIGDDTKKAVRATRLLLCALDLERIADHATNIAEEVIYMLEGKIVRHHIDEWRKRLAPEIDRQRAKRKQRKREL